MNTATELLFNGVENGDTEEVLYAIAMGADVAARNDFGESPLMVAAKLSNHECVRILLENKGNPNASWPPDEESPLIIAANQPNNGKVIDLLLAFGADLEHRDAVGNSALIYAALAGSVSNVCSLVALGADVNASNENGETPMTSAAAWGYGEIVKELIAAGADVNQTLRTGGSALMSAVSQCPHEVVVLLLHAGADANVVDCRGNSPLILSVRPGNDKTVGILLEEVEDVNHRNHAGRSAIDIARSIGCTSIEKLLREAASKRAP